MHLFHSAVHLPLSFFLAFHSLIWARSLALSNSKGSRLTSDRAGSHVARIRNGIEREGKDYRGRLAMNGLISKMSQGRMEVCRAGLPLLLYILNMLSHAYMSLFYPPLVHYRSCSDPYMPRQYLTLVFSFYPTPGSEFRLSMNWLQAHHWRSQVAAFAPSLRRSRCGTFGAVSVSLRLTASTSLLPQFKHSQVNMV